MTTIPREVKVRSEDLVVAVGGGERPHVGSVVLAQPDPSKLPGRTWVAIGCSGSTRPGDRW
jgi:hypothetical protein